MVGRAWRTRGEPASKPLLSDGAAMLSAIAVVLLSCLPAAGADPVFQRGINVAHYLAYPEGTSWPLFQGARSEMTEQDLGRLKSAGFTFVRLPVEPGPFLEATDEQRSALEDRLVDLLARAHAAGLAVMISGFPRHEAPRWTPAHILGDDQAFQRYEAFLQRLAALANTFPHDHLALELMNEPQPACRRGDGRDWTGRQEALFKGVRRIAPRLILVVTGGCWSGKDGLPFLDMTPFDDRTLVDVHYYEPFAFTHQSATWALPELRFLAGLAFPAVATNRLRAMAATKALFALRSGATGPPLAAAVHQIDRYLQQRPTAATVRRHMAEIGRWADRRGIPRARILIGEFGALRLPAEAGVPDDGSRARWLAAVRRAAEMRGFGWSMWAHRGEFGIVEDRSNAFDGVTLKALGLANAR